MSYDETIAYLIGLEATRGWDLKLERVRAALERLGSPERAYPSVLIAGTNGKGSTAAILHAAYQAAGRTAGLYTSPHLVHFTERVRVGGREIARDDVVRLVREMRSRLDIEGTGLTFFEVTTLLALAFFAEARVDVAVLEVGLGGRLDATNVVEPLASAVTSIDLEHEDYLGATLAAIAREKAGVMRPGRTTVLGPELAPEARTALLEEAVRVGARLVDAASDVAGLDSLALRGRHMRRNALVASTMLEVIGAAEPRLRVPESALLRAFGEVRWPGRLAVVREAPRVVLDAAHNLQGARALVEALPGVVGPRRVRLLFSALRDKRWREMAGILASVASDVVVTEVGGKRGLATSELASGLAGLPVRAIPDPATALDTLIREDASAPILVTGSLFLVGRIYAALLAERGVESVFDLDPPEAA